MERDRWMKGWQTGRNQTSTFTLWLFTCLFTLLRLDKWHHRETSHSL